MNMSELLWCQSMRLEMYSINLFSLFYYSPVSPKDLFRKFLKYKLSHQQLVDYGFPLNVPGCPGKAEISGTCKFSNSMDPTSQVCRCGKKFSMLEDEWYVAKSGCYYHPGKKARFGPNMGLYECCKSGSFYEGCTRSDYHVSSLHQFHDIEFKRTEVEKRKGPFTEVYALDTEMCFTTEGMEIVKVSLVWVLGGVLYTTYVKPKNKVLDYNTAFSGVSSQDLVGVNTTLEDVQGVLLKYINRNSILVGHSLENDLLSLRLIHERIVDTSVVFPHEKGFPYKNSLKSLASRYLGKSIQNVYEGHDSIEDARTCLELMLLKIHSDSLIPGGYTSQF